MNTCDHSESLYGRCVSCGKTWKSAPAVDREAVREEIRAGLNSALCNGGFPETGWSPSAEVDRITDAVMALIGGAS